MGVWGDFLLCLYLLFCVIGDVLCVVVCGCWFRVVGSRRDERINVCLAEFCALWRNCCDVCAVVCFLFDSGGADNFVTYNSASSAMKIDLFFVCGTPCALLRKKLKLFIK